MGTFKDIVDKTDIDEIMSRAEFFKHMHDFGINLTDIDNETRLPHDILKIVTQKRAANSQFYLLNMFLKKLHLCGDINIIESIVYMYKEFFDMKVVIKCLSEENLYLVRQELSKRYNLKSNKVHSTLKLYFS